MTWSLLVLLNFNPLGFKSFCDAALRQHGRTPSARWWRGQQPGGGARHQPQKSMRHV
jgi:hypothetical protein